MKKFVRSLVLSLMIIGLMASTSFATDPHGSGSTANGFLKVDAASISGGFDYDYKILRGWTGWSGAAGGIGGAFGSSEADAFGFIKNGNVSADLSTWGGGVTSTEAYRFNIEADKSIGVGSYTESYALTGAKVKVKVDPERRGFGIVGASASGFAAQDSLNGSFVGESPLPGWETDGTSWGIAGQGSVGSWEGKVFVLSGGDYRTECGSGDSKAGGGFGVEIEMIGFSYSESYRYINDGEGMHTEGMGTNVGAGTEVNSYGYDYDWDKGRAFSCSNVNGSYTVFGGAASKTVQSNNTGTALAKTVGVYSGSGSLGTNYVGNASGYTHTSMTTVNGMNGSIVSASAGMKVTSTISTPRDR